MANGQEDVTEKLLEAAREVERIVNDEADTPASQDEAETVSEPTTSDLLAVPELMTFVVEG